MNNYSLTEVGSDIIYWISGFKTSHTMKVMINDAAILTRRNSGGRGFCTEKNWTCYFGCYSCFPLGCVVLMRFTRIEWFVFYLISCLQSISRFVPISFSRQAGILAPIGLYSALYHPCEEFMNAPRMLEALNVFNLYLGFCCHKCFLGLENNLSTGAGRAEMKKMRCRRKSDTYCGLVME